MLQFGKHSLVQMPAFWNSTKHTAMAEFHRYLVNPSRNGKKNKVINTYIHDFFHENFHYNFMDLYKSYHVLPTSEMLTFHGIGHGLIAWKSQ